MDRTDVDWKGCWPAAPVPFTKDQAFDEEAWRELLRLYASWGMHGVLVNGTTGEWYAQTDEERCRIAEIAVEELKGKMPIVIGCTTYTAQMTIDLARHALKIGADGVLSTPPPYVAPSPREIVAFFTAISDAVDIPLMVYNWPRGTAIDMPADLLRKLADVPNVVAVKDSTGNRLQFFESLEAIVGKVRVFSYEFQSRLGLAALKNIGGDGYIGHPLNGAEGAEFWEAYWDGNLARCEEIGEQAIALNKLLNTDGARQPGGFPVGRYGTAQSWLKAAMNMMGQPGGYPREPLLPVDDPGDLAGIRAALESAGLLKERAVAGTRR
jgi:4-hydroxy-tetrahydrodipicolinate synthase